MYRHRPGLRRARRGFTLQEMLVSLLIGGALASGSVSLWRVLQENKMTAATNELIGHLALARSEAIIRHARVKVCPSTDQKTCAKAGTDYTFWQQGWLVFVDANNDGKPQPREIVRVHASGAGGYVIRTSRVRSAVTYQPIGTAGGANVTFAVCDSRDAALARYITVSNGGRPRMSRTTTSAVKCG